GRLGVQVVVEEGAADRIPEQVRARAGEPGPRLLESDEDGLRESSQGAVGESGKRVLLLHGGGNSHQISREHHRPARVAAHPDDHVGIEAPQDAARLPERARNAPETAQEAEASLALERPHVDGLERESGIRDHAHLEAALRTDEEDVVARMAGLHLLREREPGKEVTARAAAGDEHPHRRPPTGRRKNPPVPPLTERRMPAASEEETTLEIP